MPPENVEIVQRIWDIYTEGFERADPSAATVVYDQGLVAADATYTPMPEIPGARTVTGSEGFLEFLLAWARGWDGLMMRLEKVIDAGEGRVVAVVQQSAIGKGSRVAVEARFGIVYTLEGGQVVDRRDCRVSEALEVAGPQG